MNSLKTQTQEYNAIYSCESVSIRNQKPITVKELSSYVGQAIKSAGWMPWH